MIKKQHRVSKYHIQKWNLSSLVTFLAIAPTIALREILTEWTKHSNIRITYWLLSGKFRYLDFSRGWIIISMDVILFNIKPTHRKIWVTLSLKNLKHTSQFCSDLLKIRNGHSNPILSLTYFFFFFKLEMVSLVVVCDKDQPSSLCSN